MPDPGTTGRAAIFRKGYEHPYLIGNQIPVRKPSPLEVLVRLEVNGMCYGDVFSRGGGPPAPPRPLRPLVGGHEGVGRGHLAIQYARYMGYRVLAIDLGDKEEFCRRLGANIYFDCTRTEDLVSAISKKTGGGVHRTLVLGRSPLAYEQALPYSRGLAAVVAIGSCQLNLPLGLIQHKGLRLIGQTNATGADIAGALEIAAQIPMKVVKDERPLEDVNDALDRLKKGEVKGRIVLRL